MITLSLTDGGAVLGTIDEADLKVLIDQLEEEHAKDMDYYICTATLEMLQDGGASAHFVNLLKQAIGDAEGVEVRWERT